MKYFQALVLSMAFALAGACTALSQEMTSVVKVISGTVFTVSGGDTISLLGVGIPPAGSHSQKDAMKHLTRMIAGEDVILIPDPANPDPAGGGAKPRYVYLMNKQMVNLRMIGDGYGRVVTAPPHSMMAEFLKTGGEALPADEAQEVTPPETSQFNLDLPKMLDRAIDRFKGSGAARSSSSSTTINIESKRSSSSSRSESVQCSATTKKGRQCSRMTTNASGRCWQHE